MAETEKIAEVTEASSTSFTAQCYELYNVPALGSLVRTGDIYSVVCGAETAGIEPGRRPVARGRDEPDEEQIYRSNPQLEKLLRSEITALVVGHRTTAGIRQYLPPAPARIHSFVFPCAEDELKEFGQRLDFLTLLANARQEIPQDELIAAALRGIGRAQDDPQAFMVAAGKELAVLLAGQYQVLKSILGRLR